MVNPRVWRMTVEPDYFQFYARRSGHDWASDRVTSAGYEAHLWSDGGFVYVGTARKYGTTPVVVEAWDRRPPEDLSQSWQHIAEVSLGAGGPLEIYDWDAQAQGRTVGECPPHPRARLPAMFDLVARDLVDGLGYLW